MGMPISITVAHIGRQTGDSLGFECQRSIDGRAHVHGMLVTVGFEQSQGIGGACAGIHILVAHLVRLPAGGVQQQAIHTVHVVLTITLHVGKHLVAVVGAEFQAGRQFIGDVGFQAGTDGVFLHINVHEVAVFIPQGTAHKVAYFVTSTTHSQIIAKLIRVTPGGIHPVVIQRPERIQFIAGKGTGQTIIHGRGQPQGSAVLVHQHSLVVGRQHIGETGGRGVTSLTRIGDPGFAFLAFFQGDDDSPTGSPGSVYSSGRILQDGDGFNLAGVEHIKLFLRLTNDPINDKQRNV